MTAENLAPAATQLLKRTPPTRRDLVLAKVLDPDRLPTPPSVALQVVNAASRPDCKPAELVALLGRDPALCGKLLKAVNSCIYGLGKPVATLDRAVVLLGLATVRSLALGLSLPAMRPSSGSDPRTKEYWMESVGGAIIARELTARCKLGNPEDALVAGLLRDLGSILLAQAYPQRWAALLQENPDRHREDPVAAEAELFGIDHAEVSAELLLKWNLPLDVIEPVRHHHAPDALVASQALRDRARVLHLASQLVHLDAVVRNPAWMARVLEQAREFGLSRPELIAFLSAVVPKIEEFVRLVNQEIKITPEFTGVLTRGSGELVNLTVETNRTRLSGTVSVPAARRVAPDSQTPAPATRALRPGETVALPTAPGAAPSQELVPGGQLGDYEIRALLGRGAMGLVFRAYEPSLDREVAVKALAPELAADVTARQRFAREAKVAAAIRHDNAVAVYAVREQAGVTYLAMELVEGGSLQERLDAGGPLPAADLVRVAAEVAAGLAAAHAKGIVHRDIKPANVLLDRHTGRAKITDFGLARAADDATASRDGGLKGTPLYMAPEVFHGETATARSDLYSLGAMLYALATGRTPFTGTTLVAVLRAVLETTPVAPRTLRPDLPGWLEAVILQLLAKRPADRFASADDLLRAVRAGAARS